MPSLKLGAWISNYVKSLELLTVFKAFFAVEDFNPEQFPLPLVSREWRNGVELYLLLLPFFHSLLTKGRFPSKAGNG